MKLSEVARSIKGNLVGADTVFSGVSTDTRTLNPGELYFALRGENFDGHDFVQQAVERGASGVVISKKMNCAIPAMYVEDTLLALGECAAAHRKRFTIPVVALTGSCGKTSTKSMIATLLEGAGKVLATQGTLNNQIGAPKTLLQLDETHDYAVIELGTNQPGEIDYLAKLTQPTVSLITNIGPAHLELFKTLEGVAKEKSGIYRHLSKEGIAVINADEPFAKNWEKEFSKHRIIRFGIIQPADIMAKNIQFHQGAATFTLVTPSYEVSIRLPLIGKHQVNNALAAAACCYALGIDAQHIKQGLENLVAVDKRLVIYSGINGARIIDDTYNANPLSTEAALLTLKENEGDKIFVFGDMKELGEEEVAMHAKIGQIAKKIGVARLYAYGRLTQAAVKEFGENGFFYETQAALVNDLKPLLNKNTVVLVKGSRSMKMENVVKELIG